jgi:hypothetical protein
MSHKPSGYDRPKADLYETPAWVTLALLRHFPVRELDYVWEPAAGNHKMVDVLRAFGAAVFASDVMRYGRPHDQIFDFIDDGLTPQHILQCDREQTRPMARATGWRQSSPG